MSSIRTSITDQYGPALVALAVVLGLVSILVLNLMLRLRRVENRWRTLLDAPRGDDLERILYDHLRDRLALRAEVSEAVSRVAALESELIRDKRHLGVVKYDAFDEVGGAQSFAVALLDDCGDGVVLTSLVGRKDSRVYCKELRGGTADRPLSDEEREAVGARERPEGAYA